MSSNGFDRSDWQRSLDRNLTSAFLVTRAFLHGMKARGYGRVINVSSTTGTVSAVAGDTAYAAAKAGMVGFTRAVALEAAPYGVTINAVAPGWIATGSQTGREAAAGLRHTRATFGDARRNRGADRLPRLTRGVLRHGSVDRGRRGQLDRRRSQRLSAPVA